MENIITVEISFRKITTKWNSLNVLERQKQNL